MSKPGVSIVICCHNGANRLPQTIRHIAQQEVADHIPWEVIIVDNRSSDRSALIARSEWSRFNCTARFRIVLEYALGLSHARARGMREAQYEYVVMCDDDNWLAPDYVEKVYHIMIKKPRIGALGGLGRLVFEVPPPSYIEYSNIFAAGEQSPMSGKVRENKVYGAGCVLRKSAYDRLYKLGFQSLLTDRKGKELSSGGDYELCYALAISGYDIWYDDRLRFTHFITRDRLTWEYYIRYARESAQCFEVLGCYKAVADSSALNKISFIYITRSFVYTVRRFLRVNAERLVAPHDTDRSKILFFRHTILRYKLFTYLARYGHMIRIHNQILKLRERCSTDPVQLNAEPESILAGQFGITSFSKPFRQLQ